MSNSNTNIDGYRVQHRCHTQRRPYQIHVDVDVVLDTMQVADRPGDISILTHIFVSDNRTVLAQWYAVS